MWENILIFIDMFTETFIYSCNLLWNGSAKNKKFNITLTIVVHRWWVYGSMFDHCFKQKGFLKAVCTELYIHLLVSAR